MSLQSYIDKKAKQLSQEGYKVFSPANLPADLRQDLPSQLSAVDLDLIALSSTPEELPDLGVSIRDRAGLTLNGRKDLRTISRTFKSLDGWEHELECVGNEQSDRLSA